MTIFTYPIPSPQTCSSMALAPQGFEPITTKTSHAGFCEICENSSNAAALIIDGGRGSEDIAIWSYADLYSWWKLCRKIRKAAEYSRRPVGVCCKRGEYNVVGILAALFAGMPSCPDAASPDRLRFVSKDANVAVILAEESTQTAVRM